jgi:hypothetical protein
MYFWIVSPLETSVEACVLLGPEDAAALEAAADEAAAAGAGAAEACPTGVKSFCPTSFMKLIKLI